MENMMNHPIIPVSCETGHYHNYAAGRIVYTSRVCITNFSAEVSDLGHAQVHIHNVPAEEWEALLGETHVVAGDYPNVWKEATVAGVRFVYHRANAAEWIVENKNTATEVA